MTKSNQQRHSEYRFLLNLQTPNSVSRKEGGEVKIYVGSLGPKSPPRPSSLLPYLTNQPEAIFIHVPASQKLDAIHLLRARLGTCTTETLNCFQNLHIIRSILGIISTAEFHVSLRHRYSPNSRVDCLPKRASRGSILDECYHQTCGRAGAAARPTTKYSRCGQRTPTRKRS